MELFQSGPNRYPASSNRSTNYANVNQSTLALTVGLVAVGLPIVLYFASHAAIFDTCFHHSISHFYYASFWGTLFTGALVFIGAYLVVYQGDDVQGAEDRLATYAGLAAFGIAFFPTRGWGCDDVDFSARPFSLFLSQPPPAMPALVSGREAHYFDLFFLSGAIHYASAAILFGFLAWFALFVFTAVEPEQRKPNGRLTMVKFTRNAFYYLCGAIIIFCILAMALSALVIQFTSIDMSWWDRGNWTFWFEAIALVAFGTSWLVKGRFLGLLRDTA